MAKRLTDSIKWVGKIDWELSTFHGEELSTHRGTSYNSYLIEDEKTVLIDTAWLPYDKEFISNLKKEIDLAKIDYIIMNHSEIDHSGALPALMEEIPDVPIYCTANGEKIIRGHHHKDWNFVNVKTGDKLSIGKAELTFIEARMLHWPDTMFTYYSGVNEKILFSNDGFGQHYATESLFADKDNLEIIMEEAIKYYANILAPFSPLVSRKIDEIIAMNLPIDMICPSHGAIWRENPLYIVEKYRLWANDYKENQITIVYDSMWESTRKMAELIAEGIYEADSDVTVKLFHAGKHDKNDILTEMFKSKKVLVGSSTVNNGLLHGISGLLELLVGLKLKGKDAACFGSYGWSGEGVKLLNEIMAKAGFNVVNEGIKISWVPSADDDLALKQFGSEFAKM